MLVITTVLVIDHLPKHGMLHCPAGISADKVIDDRHERTTELCQCKAGRSM